MPQEVLEFGTGSAEKLIGLVESVLGELSSVAALFADRQDDVEFQEVDWCRHRLVESLDRGQVECVLLSAEQLASHGLCYPKTDRESNLEYLLATLDLDQGKFDSARVFLRLLEDPEVLFVLRSASDSVVLDLEPLPSRLTVQTFPWTHWDLIEAAVRGDDGEWDRRQGAQAA